MKKNRKWSLTRESAVLNIVIACLILVGTIILFVAPDILEIDLKELEIFFYVVLGGTSAFAVVLIVISALILKKTKQEDAPFPFRLALTLLVIDILLGALYLSDQNWLYFIACVCLSTMLWMDIAAFRKESKNPQVLEVEKAEEWQSEQQQSFTEKTIDELEKLNKLKNMGAITESEYELLKEDLLKNKNN